MVNGYKMWFGFLCTVSLIYPMEGPFFTGNCGRWTEEELERVVTITKENENYLHSLQVIASVLVDQEVLFKYLHDDFEICDKIDKAADRMKNFIYETGDSKKIYPPEDIAVKFLVFEEKEPEIIAAMLANKDLLENVEILNVRTENEIRNVITNLKNFPQEKVIFVGEFIEAKLERSLLDRAQNELKKGHNQLVNINSAWLEYFKDLSTSEKFLSNFKKTYLSPYVIQLYKDKRKGFYHNPEEDSRKHLSEVKQAYEEKRAMIQQLYSYIMASLRASNQQDYWYHWYPEPTLSAGEKKFLPGLDVEVVAPKKHKKKKKSKRQHEDAKVEETPIELTKAEEISVVSAKESMPFVAATVTSIDNATVEETSLWVHIKELDKNIEWYIYKVPKTAEVVIPKSYHKKIDLWLNEPAKALKDEKYDDPSSEKTVKTMEKYVYKDLAQLQKMMPIFHGFPKLCDAYLVKYAQSFKETDYKSGRECIKIVVPGHCRYEEKTIMGLFVFVIDNLTGLCFHRMFEPKKLDWQDPNLYQINLEINFPPLPSLSLG